MQKMPPALQVSPDWVSVFVLPWQGLQCWAGSRSSQSFSWGETPQAAALPLMRQLICHLGWPLPQTFLRWLFCAVLSSVPQRAAETWAEGDLIRKKLLFKLLRAMLWIHEVLQNMKISQDSAPRVSSLKIQNSRLWHVSLCLTWGLPDPAHRPGPHASPAHGCRSLPLPCWPQDSSQPLLLPKENHLRDLMFQLKIFPFILCLAYTTKRIMPPCLTVM